MENLTEWCHNLQKQINEINETHPTVIECSVCGALVRKTIAIKGQSRIKISKVRREGAYYVSTRESVFDEKESIEEVYYCKIHSPK